MHGTGQWCLDIGSAKNTLQGCVSMTALVVRAASQLYAMADERVFLQPLPRQIVTVIINVLIWDKHASLEGIGFLLVW